MYIDLTSYRHTVVLVAVPSNPLSGTDVTPKTEKETKSWLRKLCPRPFRFRGNNVSPDRLTAFVWIASRQYEAFIGFALSAGNLTKVRCRVCWADFSYSGGRSNWNKHVSSEKHITRINAYNKFMGFELVDEKNERHPYGSDRSKELNDMLKLVPALPVEPFVVLPGLPTNLFPPSEVNVFISFLSLTCVPPPHVLV